MDEIRGLTTKPMGETHRSMIHLPAPTMWPFLMALGVTDRKSVV